MANVLQTIVNDKRAAITERERAFPLAHFKTSLQPSRKSLFDALNKDRVGFILECKKASPSKGLIREHFDLDEILGAYLPHAAAISVLTDEKYFQGTFEYLSYVTERASIPVLNKDFFVAPYQVYLARHYQADAILLMLSVLDDDTYRTLAAIADELALDVLTEVSNDEEMHRAIALQAKIIGINNRDLRDLSTDLATTEKLVPLLDNASHDFVVISESGIYTHDDVKRLSSVCHGFLVGSALMAQQDLNTAVRSLIFGDTKVCGISRDQDAQAALNAGATYLGLIFVPESPRYIPLNEAKNLVAVTPARYVGVFRGATPIEIQHHVQALGLQAVQLHGTEDTEFRESLRRVLPDHVEIWQAVPMAVEPTQTQLDAALEALNHACCNRVLFDCKVGVQVGGTGQAFDWSTLTQLPHKQKWILAGGIGEHNITQADSVGSAIIDINSCVESAPGQKDTSAIARTLIQRRCASVAALETNT